MNTKILLGLGIILGLIFLVILFLFAGVLTGKRSTLTPVPQVSQPTAIPSGAEEKVPTPTVSANTPILNTYESSYFSFSYSKDLSITQGIADAEGYTAVVNAPANFTPTFRIAIQTNPSDKVNVSKIKQNMEAFGLKPSSIIVGANIPATLYTDTSGKRHQEVALIEKGGYVHRIDLSYYPAAEIPKIEGYYKDVLSSFKPR